MRAVIFDLGGVVLDSPLEAISAFETRSGIRSGAINRLVVRAGDQGAWARHERGEIDRDTFLRALREEFASSGIDLDTARLMAEIDASIRVRPLMLGAVDELRRRGLKAAALTNNWIPFGEGGLVDHFDVVVESVVEGTRKPERRIYEICLSRLGLEAADCLMLDDLGPNLKPARELGMTTVKVTSAEQALAHLSSLVE